MGFYIDGPGGYGARWVPRAGLCADKAKIDEAGDVPLLEPNYLDKHNALNRTARALTEKDMAVVAARNLHE